MKEEKSVAQTAGFLMVVMVISRILGYLRDIIIYSYYGQNRITDAYNAAFSIPDFLYMLLVGGALSSAFIPVFSAYIANNKEEEAWEIASIVLNVMMILLAIGVTVGFILAPQLINLIVPGFNPTHAKLTVLMTRIMFLQVIFMSIAGISQGILHSFKHFKAPALGSLLYNLGIIGVGLLLVKKIGIVGFSVGVVTGSLINLLIQLPALKKRNVRYKATIDLKNPGVIKIFRLILPILLGQTAIYMNLFVTQNLASTLDGGLIAALRLAERLMQLPIGVVGISMAIALFPSLTEFAATGKMQAYRMSLKTTINNVIFLSLPASVGLMMMGEPLIRMMYQQHAFTPSATQATSTALIFFSIGITGYSTIHVLSRAFYSLEDTKTPVIISTLSMGVNLILSLLLIKPMGHGGLALAYSITGLINMSTMLFFLRRKTGPLGGRSMVKTILKTGVACMVMAVAIFLCNTSLTYLLNLTFKINQAIVAISGTLLGLLVFMLMARLLKMEEEKTVRNLIRRKGETTAS